MGWLVAIPTILVHLVGVAYLSWPRLSFLERVFTAPAAYSEAAHHMLGLASVATVAAILMGHHHEAGVVGFLFQR